MICCAYVRYATIQIKLKPNNPIPLKFCSAYPFPSLQ